MKSCAEAVVATTSTVVMNAEAVVMTAASILLGSTSLHPTYDQRFYYQ